ncbi:prevent-host-death family protein [Streptomyces vinaceus]
MRTMEKVTYSELSKRPGDVADRLTRADRVRIERRDGADLILTTADREEQRDEAVGTIAATFTALMKTDKGAQALLLSLPDIFPWVRHFTEGDVREFMVEIVDAVRDAADLDVYRSLNGIVAAWKATARIKADAVEYAEAIRPLEGVDYGPVVAP